MVSRGFAPSGPQGLGKRIGKLECDFVMRLSEMEYAYVQVAMTIMNDRSSGAVCSKLHLHPPLVFGCALSERPSTYGDGLASRLCDNMCDERGAGHDLHSAHQPSHAHRL